MKISPVARPGATTGNPDEGHSAGAERVARAKAVLAGKPADAATPPESPLEDAYAERTRQSIKKIKMRTNATPAGREYEAQPLVEKGAETSPSTVSDKVEPTEAAPEATKPLSPQFAALARQQRALQVKEREIVAREQAIAAKETGTTQGPDLIAKLKADPLSVLEEQGVTYDQLTEAILARQNNRGPEYDALKAEIKAIKEGLDNQTKTQAQRDQEARTQVLTQMKKDADNLVSSGGEAYELVREAGYSQKAIDLIERTFDKTGEVLDVEEALSLIEADLAQETMKLAKAKKIQTQLAPPAQQLPQAGTQKPIRTLTNRDGTTVPLSRRERALRAARGELN